MQRILLNLILLGASVFWGALTVAAQGVTVKTSSIRKSNAYPTMMDMTFPEFKSAAAKTDVMLLPIGAIEEHGSNLPLGTDAMTATAQMFFVQNYLRRKGFETIVGPPLNIGITNETGDWTRDGTYMYPGSLNIGKETFVALYLDVLRSLRDNGMRRVFLYSGHLGGRHLEAVVQVVEQANKKFDGMQIYVMIESERLEQMKLKPSAHLLSLEKGQNFEMLTGFLGVGKEQAFSTHADGTETSLLLFIQPDAVRRGYQSLPQAPSSRFFESILSGDPTKNPSGSGGFPYEKSTAAIGKKIFDYRTSLIGEAVIGALVKK